MKFTLFFGGSLALGALAKGFHSAVGAVSIIDQNRPPINASAFSTPSVPPKRVPNFDHKFRPFTLAQVINLAEDVSVFRFLLPDPESELHLSPCSTLQVCHKAGVAIIDQPMRFYTPITPNGEKGYFDLLVKKQKAGRMTEHLFSMEVGETLLVRVVEYKLKYLPNRWKKVGMIGGGTGITPLLQIIQESLASPGDQTNLSLLFANRSEDKILLRGLLDKLQAENPSRLKVNYVVDSSGNPDWKGYSGHITKEMLIETMPPPSRECMLLVCGPDKFMTHLVGAPPELMKVMSGSRPIQPAGGGNLLNYADVGGLMGQIGYDRDMMFRF